MKNLPNFDYEHFPSLTSTDFSRLSELRPLEPWNVESVPRQLFTSALLCCGVLRSLPVFAHDCRPVVTIQASKSTYFCALDIFGNLPKWFGRSNPILQTLFSCKVKRAITLAAPKSPSFGFRFLRSKSGSSRANTYFKTFQKKYAQKKHLPELQFVKVFLPFFGFGHFYGQAWTKARAAWNTGFNRLKNRICRVHVLMLPPPVEFPSGAFFFRFCKVRV